MATGAVVLLGLLGGDRPRRRRPDRAAGAVGFADRQRFAEGHLTERMPVRGEDDMARLAVSFNDMAEACTARSPELEEFGNLQRRFDFRCQPRAAHPLTTVRMAAT